MLNKAFTIIYLHKLICTSRTHLHIVCSSESGACQNSVSLMHMFSSAYEQLLCWAGFCFLLSPFNLAFSRKWDCILYLYWHWTLPIKLQKIGPVVLKKKSQNSLQKDRQMDAKQKVIRKPHLSFQLRWAKNQQPSHSYKLDLHA